MSNSSQATTGFDQFGLHNSLLKAVDKAGFETPTPIQVKAIPDAMQGRDVLGLAQTGTGKTAAFGLALLHRLFTAQSKGTRALILAPTRELATQINEELRMLASFTPIKTVTIFGGVSAGPQIQALQRKPDIIIACPGRLLDLFGQGKLRLGNIETFILDEADQMFDMGFFPDIRRIVAELPKKRQNLLFSATMPSDIRKLANETLNDPLTVEVDFKGPAKTVTHALYPVDNRKKTDLLKFLLAKDHVGTSIVFTRTKHRARKLADQLGKTGMKAAALQGNMSQNQRDRVMREFRNGKLDVMVATDIAARGIDVAGVSHVINYDIPTTAEAYTHRIGRTGRAENSGEAFTLVTPEDRKMVRDIERKIGEKIERKMEEGFSVDIDSGGGSAGGGKPNPGTRRPHNNNRGPRSGGPGGNNQRRSNNRRRRPAAS